MNEFHKISMQYPFDSTGQNQLFDGERHEIIPTLVRTIVLNGREFLIMNYFDVNADSSAITLLTRIGNTYAKVPLDNYDYLIQYINNNDIKEIELDSIKLPEQIPLAQTLGARQLFEPDEKARENDSYTFLEYVPLTNEGNGVARNGAFSPNSVTIHLDDSEDYKFSKSPSFPVKDINIQEGINQIPSDALGIFKHRFKIKVLEGTTGTIVATHSDGTAHMYTVLMIPGIHDYVVTYGLCKTKEDYLASRQANDILISATFPKYRDRHSSDRAFCDGCKRKIPIKFYNADKEEINNNNNAFGSL